MGGRFEQRVVADVGAVVPVSGTVNIGTMPDVEIKNDVDNPIPTQGLPPDTDDLQKSFPVRNALNAFSERVPVVVSGIDPVANEKALAIRNQLDALGASVPVRVDMNSLPAFASTPNVAVVDQTTIPFIQSATLFPEQSASNCETARAAGNQSYLAALITAPANKYVVLEEVAFIINDDTVTSDNRSVAPDALQRALSWPAGPQPFICGGFTSAAPVPGFFPNKTLVKLINQLDPMACGAWGFCGRGMRWGRGIYATPGETVYIGWQAFAAAAASADMLRLRIQYSVVDAAGFRLMIGQG